MAARRAAGARLVRRAAQTAGPESHPLINGDGRRFPWPSHRRGATVRALDGVADLREHPHRAARLAAVPRPPVRVRARSITAGLLLLVLHLSDEGLRDSA